jgi:hypothetical protein
LPAFGGMLAKPPALVFAPILLAYVLLIDRRETPLAAVTAKRAAGNRRIQRANESETALVPKPETI